MRILRGLARLNMDQLDLPLNASGQKVTAGQFGPVVAANRAWFSSQFVDLVQQTCHPSTGEAGINLQRETLSRISIDYGPYCNISLARRMNGLSIILPFISTTAFPSRSASAAAANTAFA
jgi:hypothetical protein